jgi:hypothetical protein
MSALAEQAPVRLAPPLSVAKALRKAVRAWYENSWRLFLLNTLFSTVAIAILVLALYQPVALLLLLVLGALAAALVHCAVTIVHGDELRLVDALVGLRLHWRRGLLLGALGAAVVVLTALALGFYAGRGALAWPLAVLTLYVTGMLAVYQLALWPLAIVERARPLRAVFRSAALTVAARPLAFVGLGLALLAINLIAFVAAVLPFLTMTISYSFLAAAYLTLPQTSVEEE